MIIRIGTTINPIGCEDYVVCCLDLAVIVTRYRSHLDLSYKIYLDITVSCFSSSPFLVMSCRMWVALSNVASVEHSSLWNANLVLISSCVLLICSTHSHHTHIHCNTAYKCLLPIKINRYFNVKLLKSQNYYRPPRHLKFYGLHIYLDWFSSKMWSSVFCINRCIW